MQLTASECRRIVTLDGDDWLPTGGTCCRRGYGRRCSLRRPRTWGAGGCLSRWDCGFEGLPVVFEALKTSQDRGMALLVGADDFCQSERVEDLDQPTVG